MSLPSKIQMTLPNGGSAQLSCALQTPRGKFVCLASGCSMTPHLVDTAAVERQGHQLQREEYSGVRQHTVRR